MQGLDINELFLLGAHYGKRRRFCHPRMNAYIFSTKKGTDTKIIDLEKSVASFQELTQQLQTFNDAGQKILFVSTNPKLGVFLKQALPRTGHFYVIGRWWGGTLTNLTQIQKRILHLNTLIKNEKDGYLTTTNLTKRERLQFTKEKNTLLRQLEGIMEMKRLPDAIFVIDPMNEKIVCQEAKKLKIPLFALANTDADPQALAGFITLNSSSERPIIYVMIKLLQTLFPTLDWSDLKVPEKPERKVFTRNKRFGTFRKPTPSWGRPIIKPTAPTTTKPSEFAAQSSATSSPTTTSQPTVNPTEATTQVPTDQPTVKASGVTKVPTDQPAVKSTETTKIPTDQPQPVVAKPAEPTATPPVTETSFQIDFKLLKQLRAATLAGLTFCKEALVKHQNDYQAALQWLKQQHRVVVDKQRANNQGLIATFVNLTNHQAVICNLKCETDFVARNQAFQAAFRKLGTQLADQPQLTSTLAEQIAAPIVQALINKFSENIKFAKPIILVKTAAQQFGFYNHNNYQRTALLLITAAQPIVELGEKLAMHVVVNRPTYIELDQIKPADLATQTAKIREQVMNDAVKRDADLQAKIIAGKLKKTIAEITLTEQAFVHQPTMKVKDILNPYQAKILKMFYQQEGN